MGEKSGSQVVDVFGVEVELIGDMLISKRDAQRALQRKLDDCTDRHARASVSSWRAEGWVEPAAQGSPGEVLARLPISAPLCHVNSFVGRAMTQADAAYDASVTNGKLGGRPAISRDATLRR